MTQSGIEPATWCVQYNTY